MGANGDFEGKMACIVKCHFNHKLSIEEKNTKGRKEIDQTLMAELQRIYREEFGLDTEEELKPNLIYNKPPE